MTDETRADLADSLASLYEKFAKELPLLENEMEIALPSETWPVSGGPAIVSM